MLNPGESARSRQRGKTSSFGCFFPLSRMHENIEPPLPHFAPSLGAQRYAGISPRMVKSQPPTSQNAGKRKPRKKSTHEEVQRAREQPRLEDLSDHESDEGRTDAEVRCGGRLSPCLLRDMQIIAIRVARANSTPSAWSDSPSNS